MYRVGDLTVIWEFTAPNWLDGIGSFVSPFLSVLHTTAGLNSAQCFRASRTMNGESHGWHAGALVGPSRPLYTVLMVESDFDYVQG